MISGLNGDLFFVHFNFLGVCCVFDFIVELAVPDVVFCGVIKVWFVADRE